MRGTRRSFASIGTSTERYAGRTSEQQRQWAYRASASARRAGGRKSCETVCEIARQGHKKIEAPRKEPQMTNKNSTSNPYDRQFSILGFNEARLGDCIKYAVCGAVSFVLGYSTILITALVATMTL